MISSPQKWEAVKALFEALLEQHPSHHSSFLESQCADPTIRAEVERLLAEHAQAASFLSSAFFVNVPAKQELQLRRLKIGELLAGRFRIVRFIAAGGMGEVYEAEDEELQERVALKTIRPEILAQPHAVARFKQEVHLARKVTHPNVCRIFDLFRHTRENGNITDETVFVSMELLNGKTLDVELKEAGPMSPGRALPIARSIASALSAAHGLGIIHRDLKPGNIVLARTDEPAMRPVVTDFGLAIQEAMSDATVSLPAAHLVVGTPAYMSPEQLEGRPATPASDIYAFGLLMYEMVTGVRPFQGDTPVSVALKRLSEKPISPRKFSPAVAPAWDAAILRCLERDPAKRFASAKEIESLLSDSSPSTTLGVNVRALARSSRRPVVAIPVVLFLLSVAIISAWWIQRSSRIHWAREQAIPQIAELIQNEQFEKAFSLALQAEHYIPNDPRLIKFWPDISLSGPIKTDPPGVSVFRRSYNRPHAKWEFVGLSPIEKRRFPPVDSEWKFELKGFATAELATFAADPPDQLTVTMDEQSKAPPGMVHVELAPAASQSTAVGLYGLPGYEGSPAVSLRNYWIDKYEVTNADFKRFLDGGGYQNQKYWNFPFRKDDRVLSWKEAMALFRDRTGRPGPATWVQGEYPPGQDDYPVTGVSWFEAAAYAAFVGKTLPTIYHWTAAASPWESPAMLPASNFSGVGPARVGSYGGMSWAGAYDMAGNVKEWVLNQASSGERYIMGGAWDEPTYLFNEPDARSPFQRSANFGFRCAQFTLQGKALKAADPVTFQVRDFAREKPASDQLFRAYKSLYSYDKTPLHAVVESIQETANWRQEKISYDAPYGNERITAYLFLPRNVSPPLQTVVHFPGAGAVYTRSFAGGLADYGQAFDFIVKSGRAVLFPVYKGTFERADGYQIHHRNTSSYRDHVIYWSKDLSRSLDYLETRPDIDHAKLAYEGFSWGAAMGAILPAVDNRFKALVLLAPGFYLEKCSPEVDQLNFAPHVKVPALMLNGRFDFIFPPGSSQEPMFRLLGTPSYEKRRVVYDTGHDIPRNELIKETLAWLDKYLGTVR